jgi:hypothetical protein
MATAHASNTTTPIVITGTPDVSSAFRRYRLSNGWFTDCASRSCHYHQGGRCSGWSLRRPARQRRLLARRANSRSGRHDRGTTSKA